MRLSLLLLLIWWAHLAHVIAYGRAGIITLISFVLMVLLFWEVLSEIDRPRKSDQKVDDRLPQVTGHEDRTALIAIICPHCHEEEFRIHGGENWCENTGDPFFVNVVPYDWAKDGR
jgi:hypothetical protein